MAALDAAVSATPGIPARLPMLEPIRMIRPSSEITREVARTVAISPVRVTAQNRSNSAWSRSGSSTRPNASIEALGMDGWLGPSGGEQQVVAGRRPAGRLHPAALGQTAEIEPGGHVFVLGGLRSVPEAG